MTDWQAAEDRAQAAAVHAADEVDTLTGARRRGPGLADVQRELDRAHGGNGQLVAAYIDVDRLKATNDSKGHRAGDVMLKHIVSVLRSNLRSYEPVVRVGGDEFVCTISNISRTSDSDLTTSPQSSGSLLMTGQSASASQSSRR